MLGETHGLTRRRLIPREVTPAHAKSVLVDVGLWTEQKETGSPEGWGGDAGAGGELDGGGVEAEVVGSATGRDGGDGFVLQTEAGAGVGVVPWAADVLEAASQLGRERDRRVLMYQKKQPQAPVGAPAPFGRCSLSRIIGGGEGRGGTGRERGRLGREGAT